MAWTVEEGKISLCPVNLVLGYPLVIDPCPLGTDIDFLFVLFYVLRTGVAFCCLGQACCQFLHLQAAQPSYWGTWKYDTNVGCTHFQLASVDCWQLAFFVCPGHASGSWQGYIFCTFLGDASCTHGKATKGILVSMDFIGSPLV